MNIQQAEVKFGKRWNLWTKEEQIEFVKALDGTEPRIPGILNLACLHWEHIPDVFEEKQGIKIKERMRAKL